MDNTIMQRALSGVIALSAVLLVGLTLYTAYFGVFPDGIQRSAHLMLVMILVFGTALRTTLEPETQRQSGSVILLKRVWVVLALLGGMVATGHQLFNFDAINDQYGAITS